MKNKKNRSKIEIKLKRISLGIDQVKMYNGDQYYFKEGMIEN